MLVDRNTKVLTQGMTGATGPFQTKQALIYGSDDGAFVVVASKAGAATHPDWYLNLMAHPETSLHVVDQHVEVRARTASGSERRRLWELMTNEFPNYDQYQRRTDREIPVVVLEPR